MVKKKDGDAEEGASHVKEEFEESDSEGSSSSDEDDDELEQAEDQAEDYEFNCAQDLLSGELLGFGHEVSLFHDSAEGEYFLIDGDSLLLESSLTETWRPGQQLHLFYIVELYLKQLIDNGGKFQVVFFQDMAQVWSASPSMQLFRQALILHFQGNMKQLFPVHTQWKNPFCPLFLQFLKDKPPSFLLVDFADDYEMAPGVSRGLSVLTHVLLAHRLNVVLIHSLHQKASRMFGLFFRHERIHAAFWETCGGEIVEEWTSMVTACKAKSTPASLSTDNIIPFSAAIDALPNLRDKICFAYIVDHWKQTEAAQSNSKYLNHIVLYFSAISSLDLKERIRIASQYKTESLKSMYKTKNSSSSSESSKQSLKLFDDFSECISQVLSVLASPSFTSASDQEVLADIVDINLFNKFVDVVDTQFDVSEVTKGKYYELLGLLVNNGIPLEQDVLQLNVQTVQQSVEKQNEGSFMKVPCLAPVDCSLVQEYTDPIRSAMKFADDKTEIERFTSGNDFDETFHWHSGKPLKDDIDLKCKTALSDNSWLRKKQLKDIQKLTSYFRMYAESLQSDFKPQIIPTTSQQEKSKPANAQSWKESAKAKKAPKQTKAQKIIEQNTSRIRNEEHDKLKVKWQACLRKVESENSTTTKIKFCSEFISKYTSSFAPGKEVPLFEDPYLVILELQFTVWKESFVAAAKAYEAAAQLMHTVHLLLDKTFSEKLKAKLMDYFNKLGFEDVVGLVFGTSNLPTQKGAVKTSKKTYPVGLSYKAFQMKHMGHLMKRNERTDPDPRVTSFIPDTWQRELLNAVDHNKSAVIVAPTSSGKTFCSYYCMEKVLREDNDGIVVYVAPTKALVNQVQASIYAKFTKKMPAGQSLCGVFTRDYQHDALVCQVLVTVPACLEILLLSPRRQVWASKLRYVIFDEVHCIDSEMGGEIWEHLLTMIRCPFLALSATISNAGYFHDWLAMVKRFVEEKDKDAGSTDSVSKRGNDRNKYKVELVVYSERYSDIESCVYNPREAGFVHAHPCTYLDPKVLADHGFPSGFNLSPSEAFQLWEAATQVFTEDSGISRWNPDTNLCLNQSNLYVTKVLAREYEVSLKEEIKQRLTDNLPKAAKLVEYFRKKVIGNSSECFEIDDISLDLGGMLPHFPKLIDKLKEDNKLPALVFMNNRHGIEMLSKTLKKHVHKKLSTSEKLRKVEEKMASTDSMHGSRNFKKDMKKQVDSKDKKNAVEDKKDLHQSSDVDKGVLEYNRERAKLCYSTPGSISDDLRSKVIEKVKNSVTRDMLDYGIGYHHAGTDTKHRRAVEILFRSRNIQVVTATGTLALGVHMPCKTVVFAGDDYYLDALNYRQMSGRSGRRGFDNIGNVVFFGVPFAKICKLTNADVSQLKGRIPFTCSYVLKLLLFASNASDTKDAHKKALTLLSHPFISHKSPAIQVQLKHYFLFATDFLIRQDLIDIKGVPQGLAGLVSHIHYHEPGNMVFVHLLKEGLFHNICHPVPKAKPVHDGQTCNNCHASPIVGDRFQCKQCAFPYNLCDSCIGRAADHKRGKEEHTKADFVKSEPRLKMHFSDETLRLLVSILCHLFIKTNIADFKFQSGTKLLKVAPECGSKVILDDLPEDFDAAISRYNSKVTSIFGDYIRCVSQSKDITSVDNTLPLSKTSSVKGETTQAQDNVAVTPIARLSGCNDADIYSHCQDSRELNKLVPSDLYMDANFIPVMDVSGIKNAYPLDFFKHKSIRALVQDNGIQMGDVYTLLQDFMLLVMSIATALEQLGPDGEDEDDAVIWAFKHLAYVYQEKFAAAFPGYKNKTD